jgi:hypothetical protein
MMASPAHLQRKIDGKQGCSLSDALPTQRIKRRLNETGSGIRTGFQENLLAQEFV